MKYTRQDFATGIDCMMGDGTVRSVTVFCGDLNKEIKQRIRMTRIDKNSFRVTYGKPNWGEREWLKLCKKAKCKPRKVLLKFYKKK